MQNRFKAKDQWVDNFYDQISLCLQMRHTGCVAKLKIKDLKKIRSFCEAKMFLPRGGRIIGLADEQQVYKAQAKGIDLKEERLLGRQIQPPPSFPSSFHSRCPPSPSTSPEYVRGAQTPFQQILTYLYNSFTIYRKISIDGRSFYSFVMLALARLF